MNKHVLCVGVYVLCVRAHVPPNWKYVNLLWISSEGEVDVFVYHFFLITS